MQYCTAAVAQPPLAWAVLALGSCEIIPLAQAVFVFAPAFLSFFLLVVVRFAHFLQMFFLFYFVPLRFTADSGKNIFIPFFKCALSGLYARWHFGWTTATRPAYVSRSFPFPILRTFTHTDLGKGLAHK